MSDAAAPPSGCLTDAQLAEVGMAEPGKAPEGLARHLASCQRCQERVLFGAARPPAKKKQTPEFPSVRRAMFYAALVLVAILVFFWSLAKLAGRLQ
jgi:hypothetical protein